MNASRKWFIVALLSLGMVIAYIDRFNLSVVLALEEFRQLFQLSDAHRGTLNSSFFWTYALLQIPAGWLVDRYGCKRPYALGFLFWCLVSALCGAVNAVWQILTLRLLLGVGEAVVTPASMRWIRFNYPESRRGLAVGLYMTGTKFGPAVAGPIVVALIQGYGWRWMFVILGVGGLVWLLGWLLAVKDDDRQLEREQARASGAAPVPFARVLTSPAMWGIVLATFSYNYFVYFSLTWLPAYLKERRGLSLQDMGWYTMFSFGGMAIMAAAAGWAADLIIARGRDPIKVRKAFTIAGFMLAATEVIGARSDSHAVALFFAVFSLSGLGLATANYWALTQSLFPGAAIGRIVGVQNCASNVGGIVAPLMTGWLKQATGSYEAPMQVIWVLLLIGVAAYLVLVRVKYTPRGA